MTTDGRHVDPETRRAEAEFEMRRHRWWEGCSSGCAGWVVAVAVVALGAASLLL
jgi:CBS domain-containing protein